MKAFISYSSNDKKKAGWVKSNLAWFGIDCFLAHEDIEPSIEWQGEILRQLRICDIFIPIITPDFNSSKWTDQETGFAMCREIPIFPLGAGEAPRGFINKYQAFPLDVKDANGFRTGIARILSKNPATRKEFMDLLIETFSGSNNFDEAGVRSKLLLESKSYFSTKQRNKILEVAASNGQIYYSFRARDNLRLFIEEYRDKLKLPLVKKLEKKMSQ